MAPENENALTPVSVYEQLLLLHANIYITDINASRETNGFSIERERAGCRGELRVFSILHIGTGNEMPELLFAYGKKNGSFLWRVLCLISIF